MGHPHYIGVSVGTAQRWSSMAGIRLLLSEKPQGGRGGGGGGEGVRGQKKFVYLKFPQISGPFDKFPDQ